MVVWKHSVKVLDGSIIKIINLILRDEQFDRVALGMEVKAGWDMARASALALFRCKTEWFTVV